MVDETLDLALNQLENTLSGVSLDRALAIAGSTYEPDDAAIYCRSEGHWHSVGSMGALRREAQLVLAVQRLIEALRRDLPLSEHPLLAYGRRARRDVLAEAKRRLGALPAPGAALDVIDAMLQEVSMP